MDFGALKAALAARGFQRFTDAQLGQAVNDAVTELDAMERWGYREASVTGTAPLAIADLGEVDQVFDMSVSPTVPLTKRSYQEMVSDFADLSLSLSGGEPLFWYRATPAGVPTVAVFPVSTRTVGVQYWRVGPTLVDDADVPISPERYHSLYVDIAERRLLRQKGDYQAMTVLQPEVDRQVALMRDALLPDEDAAWQTITGESCDW